MGINELMEAFRKPESVYRTMPQWSWNGELSRERITEQLEQFAERGAGGVFPHARPGLITAYLSDEWFEMWGHGMREAERLGLQFHIYDEFCCPGGHAGGHVVAEKPHLVQQVLELQVVTDSLARPRGRTLGCFRWDRDEGGVEETDADAVRAASAERPVLALAVRAGEHRPAKGGFALPDMLRRETAETFIATTHQRYAERFADRFGTTVRYVFCDEPQIFGSSGAWPFSDHLAREFRRDHDYELTEHLGALCFGLEGAREVRFDYWWTVNRLYNGNFMRTLHDWCEEHGLMFTGHIMENTWPRPRANPDVMAALRWMHAPGNDLLGFQFSSTTPLENGLYLLNAKQVSSVAAQLGRRWIVTESCGGAGYEASFDVFKPLEDYLLALGVNVMDPHLTHQTLSGSRKYDWPHTLSDHSPWWRHYRRHADHVARANAVLSRGVERNRVLVLEPTTTAWLHYAPEPFRLGAEDPLDELESVQEELLVELYGAQVDFDVGDEFIMEELGGVEDGRLIVGEREYELVVVPPGMQNWTSSTLELLRVYLEAGGHIVSGARAPGFVDGRPSEAPGGLAEDYSGQWETAAGVPDLVEAVRRRVPPRFSAPDGSPLPKGLCWRRSELPDGGVLYFLCNPWGEPLEAEVQTEIPHLTALRTETGRTIRLQTEVEEGRAVASLSLAPHEHALWLNTAEPVKSAVGARPATGRSVQLEPGGIERLAENVLVVDYCDLETGGKRFEETSTLRADRRNWRLQGFAGNPWQGAHQYKRTVIDRPIDTDSGFAVSYRFSVDEDLPESARGSLRVAVERMWLYSLSLNGRPLDQDEAGRWFDEQVRALPVGRFVRPGENVLTLTAEPFHMLCEIMPVYLLGDFALRPGERGFRVAPTEPLERGDWTGQGMPFYADAVRHSFSFELAASCGALRVRPGEWKGSVISAGLDGQSQGVIYSHHEALEVEGGFEPGEHQLTLEVVGNMRNLMGPHHAEGLPGPWTWIQGPDQMPPGAEYRLEASGLYGPPELQVLDG